MPSLIINADDFGASASINSAIVSSFTQGWCSSATIIPNYPSVEEAFELAHEYGLEDKLGVHVNLVTREPLTEGVKRNTILCTDGRFDSGWRTTFNRGVHFSTAEKAMVADELRAQIRRCLDAKIMVTHIDSHTHAHTVPGIASIVLGVAREFGIHLVRIARNCGRPASLPKEAYKALFNIRLRINGFQTTDYFGEIADILQLLAMHPNVLHQKAVEIMVHPDIFDGKVLDADYKELGYSVANIPKYETAVSYAEYNQLI